MQTSSYVMSPFPGGSGSIQVLYDLGFSFSSCLGCQGLSHGVVVASGSHHPLAEGKDTGIHPAHPSVVAFHLYF